MSIRVLRGAQQLHGMIYMNIYICAKRDLHGLHSQRKQIATPRGFEPLRAEPNGFRVHLLNRSDTVSVKECNANYLQVFWLRICKCICDLSKLVFPSLVHSCHIAWGNANLFHALSVCPSG